MANKITSTQIEEAYSKGKAVFDGRMTLSDAINALVANGSMNKSSATDYIRNFLHMMKGLEYQRTLNLPATEYFLASISKDYGAKYLNLALNSVNKHLNYYEGIGKSKQKSIRDIVELYWAKSAVDSTIEEHLAEFSDEVDRSLNDGAEKRKVRLNVANKLPASVIVQTTVYRRNPDVVAEVLSRAAGVCERCEKPAPFLRAKDSTPYLEVHHKIRLSNGGEDTVKNAIAICPNCHRELHFGQGNV
ncbi:TPA: HNH endonuclease [Raoultella ornithinolytica]|uniref:HNH endonuclease n=1 Tax=Enterobacteriaceae TaxID=543 RepID=UPI0022F09162|nr:MULTISPECIES: HNH endonuclease [Enterobacteriaceae]MDA4331243.1 HNH endonuclease [Escherichia coli]MDA4713616.1 HNH endonuclease [Enterobacter hormaechei]